MSKSKQTIVRNRKPFASVGAQALNKQSKLIRNGETVDTATVEVEQTNKDIAISGVTLVEARAEAFVKQWSEQTQSDITAGYEADEKRRRNCLELMFDYRQDYASDLAGLMALPAPYTEAPKGMTPHKWNVERKNEAWPFDKWSERVSQSQGGKRNVNYSFYLIAFDRSADGMAIAKRVADLKEMITNYGKSPLVGDYQGWEKDQLQTELNKYEGRRSTAGENIRKAIGLHRAFTLWERYAEQLTKTGKGPWKYPQFTVAIVTDKDGNQEPTSSKKPIRFGVVELTRDASGKEREAVTFKPPVSVDTFLNYDVDLYGAAIKAPGADVYNAVVESAKIESEGAEVKQIKLPFSTESWIAVQGLSAAYVENDDNRAAIIKRLVKKDAAGKFENEAEIKSVVDQYLEMMPVIQVLKPIYNKLVLSDVQAAKLENADKLATN